jgi:hypothetical protein
MIILGINLSSTFQKKSKKVIEKDDMELSNKTIIAVVVGKMIVMPVIGILSAWFLEHNYNPFPDGEYWTSVHVSWIWRLCITCTGSFELNSLLMFNTTLLSLSHLKEIDATCYLVMMIVFITPTGSYLFFCLEIMMLLQLILCHGFLLYQEEMAKVIGWQYVVSPVVLR